ncbi:hypothetical protein [Polaribacter glomeratus]|nr:hypothetical protein [Polaribacter glomeratus]
MKEAQENLEESNDPRIEFFTISLSLIILTASVAFLIESIF